jgi:hypothetical protein
MRVMRGGRSIVRRLTLRQLFSVSRLLYISLCGFFGLASYLLRWIWHGASCP